MDLPEHALFTGSIGTRRFIVMTFSNESSPSDYPRNASVTGNRAARTGVDRGGLAPGAHRAHSPASDGCLLRDVQDAVPDGLPVFL